MTPETLIQFGLSIRRWRKELGYNQEELGGMAGISKQYISNIERAEPSSYTGEPTQPSIEVVDSLAKALQRPIQEMRDLAGYGIEGASYRDDDRAAGAARAAEMIEGFLSLPRERQDRLLAMLRVLQADHPELLEMMRPPIKIMKAEDLTESDAEEDTG